MNASSEVILARWTERFVAWLIDFVIVSISLALLFFLLSIPFWMYYAFEDVDEQYRGPQSYHYLISSLVFFLYWTYFESKTRQSLGKKVMNLKDN